MFVCPFSFQQLMSLHKLHHTTQIKKIVSNKYNFKKIYILIKDSILFLALLTFIETAVSPFRAGSLRSPTIWLSNQSSHTRAIKDSINLSILQVKTIFLITTKKCESKTIFWSLCYPRLRDDFNVHFMQKHRKWTARLPLSAGCFFIAQARFFISCTTTVGLYWGITTLLKFHVPSRNFFL